MNTRIENKYTLKVWNDSYNRYVEYVSYTTLERLKEQINRMIKSYNNPNMAFDWSIWRGCKRVDLKTAKYIIEHKRYKITKEELLSEVLGNEL